MKKIVTAMALLALAFGASVAMARGPETQTRVGAFAKGGTGVESREGAAAYRLSASDSTEAKAPTTQHAARCPKCKTVIETKPMSSSRYMPESEAVMQCEDCTNAVMNFLAKGEFKHTCTTCGDRMEEMCKH